MVVRWYDCDLDISMRMIEPFGVIYSDPNTPAHSSSIRIVYWQDHTLHFILSNINPIKVVAMIAWMKVIISSSDECFLLLKLDSKLAACLWSLLHPNIHHESSQFSIACKGFCDPTAAICNHRVLLIRFAIIDLRIYSTILLNLLLVIVSILI